MTLSLRFAAPLAAAIALSLTGCAAAGRIAAPLCAAYEQAKAADGAEFDWERLVVCEIAPTLGELNGVPVIYRQLAFSLAGCGTDPMVFAFPEEASGTMSRRVLSAAGATAASGDVFGRIEGYIVAKADGSQVYRVEKVGRQGARSPTRR